MTIESEELQNPGKGYKGSKGSFKVSDIYAQFEPLIKLSGDSYNPIKRAVFYSIIGSVICENKISLSDIKEDTRMNLFIPLKSGYGKREIKEVIKQSISSLGMNYCEPTSLHSEQLIGKTISIKGGVPLVNKGHLADDYLVFEEATELFTDKMNQETRDYIKIALDPIGFNEIYKKSVDTVKENAVRYYPRCTVVFFFQPLPIEDKIVTRGLLRRGIILSVEPNKGERYDALEQSFNDNDASGNWNQWIDFLKGLKVRAISWEFDVEVKTRISDLTKKLLHQGFEKGNKTGAYTDIMFFSLRNLLLKMGCIQAVINDREKLTVSDIEIAFKDLSIFWAIQLDFIIQKVKGDMDYMDINKNEKLCLMILQDNRCFSEGNSSLMIKKFINLISESLSCTERSASHLYYGLKESGYINSKQVGKRGSKVWLTPMGKKKVKPYKSLGTLVTLDRKPSIFQRFRRESKPIS